jgi:hypothetical protein
MDFQVTPFDEPAEKQADPPSPQVCMWQPAIM